MMLVALLMALAPECATGQSMTQVANIIEEDGGAIIDLIDVKGDGFDQILIARFQGRITGGAFNAGCSAGVVFIFGLAEDVGVGI